MTTGQRPVCAKRAMAVVAGRAGAAVDRAAVRRGAAVRARGRAGADRRRRSGLGLVQRPRRAGRCASCRPSAWSRSSRCRRRSRSVAAPLGLPGRRGRSIRSPGRGCELGGPLSPFRGGRVAHVRVMTRFPRRGLQTLAPPSLMLARSARPRARRAGQRRAAAAAAGAPAHRARAVADAAAAAGTSSCPTANRTPRRSPPSTSTGCARTGPGRPPSRIHWPAVARGAGLIERRLRADGDTRPLVVLDPRGVGSARAARRRGPRGRLADARARALRRLRAAARRRAARDGDRPGAEHLAGRLRPAGAGRGRAARARAGAGLVAAAGSAR